MYAAIASRSIGTRLLTSFARLSLPRKRDLDRIKVPLFFSFENVKNSVFGRRKAANAASVGATTSSGVRLNLEPPLSSAAYSSTGTVLTDEAAQAEEDDEQHFRRFLQELPRWLSYDVCSRVCMSFGMNQMLQALSYYVLGIIWHRSPLAAGTSFIAVKMLALLVLWLDVGDHSNSTVDLAALIFLHLAPPVLGAFLLYSTISPWILFSGATNTSHRSYKAALSLLATLCFLGHAGWLWYMSSVMDRAGTKLSKFRPGDFANVLEWVKQDPVRKDLVDRLRVARENLELKMADIEQEEVAGNAPTSRGGEELETLRQQVLHACDEVASDDHPSKHAELVRANETLKRLVLWSAAPELLAALQSLLLPEVTKSLTSRENSSVNEAYQNFLQLCQKYDLGLWKESNGDSSGSSSWWKKRGKPVLTARPLAPGEECTVCVEPSGNKAPFWIQPRVNGEAEDAAVGCGREIRLRSILQEELPLWRSGLARLNIEARDTFGATHSSRTGERAEAGKRQAAADMRSRPPTIVDGGPSPGKWTAPEGREEILPPDELPVRLVRYFSMGLVVWWCIAGFAHATVVLTQEEEALERLANATGAQEIAGTGHARNLHVEWPEPAHLFKVDSLFCRNSMVWVSDGFSVYAGASPFLAFLERPTATPELYKFRQASEDPIRGMICEQDNCEMLEPPASSHEHWNLAPTPTLGGHVHTSLTLPPSWRRVTGEWMGKNTATLAAWDGKTVFAASLERHSTTSEGGSRSDAVRADKVHVRFALDPAVGLCPGGLDGCKALLQEEQSTYDDVRSLQLLHGGHALAVLLAGGIVDFWDLDRGLVHERFVTGKNYSSMCQSGNDLVFSEDESTGPLLVAMPVPRDILKLMQAGEERREAQAVNATDVETRVMSGSRSTQPGTAAASSEGHGKRSKKSSKAGFLGASLLQVSLYVRSSMTLVEEKHGLAPMSLHGESISEFPTNFFAKGEDL
eukprot:TRINITY_DN4390_c1_g1_i1.p1 TRINITY_DN4390_c1_g1~~TRINITY_DN4390_c1_g1_i1.p1  ORF type:complete len:1133 (-),score=208.76 TRINITY_DN4390_c1_g1_i1:61-2979(-)